MSYSKDQMQDVIDRLYAMVMLVSDKEYSAKFVELSDEEKAEWIKRQLPSFIKGDSVGSKWLSLKEVQ